MTLIFFKVLLLVVPLLSRELYSGSEQGHRGLDEQSPAAIVKSILLTLR